MNYFSAEPVCNLRSLRSVSLKVPDTRPARDFYHEVWGLSTVEEDTDKFWLRGTGSEHHILRLEKGEQNALGGVSFALSTPQDVDRAATKLNALGIPLFREPGPLDDAAGGYGLQLIDPEGRLVELSANVHAVVSQEPAGRRALRFAGQDAARADHPPRVCVLRVGGCGVHAHPRRRRAGLVPRADRG